MDTLVESELKEAVALSGCAICRIGEAAARRYLRFLLHESVNDVAARERLLAAWGLCRRHAWHFWRFESHAMHDGLGTAILGEGLIEALQHALSALPPPAGDGRSRIRQRNRQRQELQARLEPQAPCPACAEQGQAESYALSVLLAVLAQDAWRERFAPSDGLCIPHLRVLMAEGQPEACDRIDWMLGGHRDRLARVLGDLKEYIRKHDHRFREEPRGAEDHAVQRATALLAGVWFDLPGAIAS